MGSVRIPRETAFQTVLPPNGASCVGRGGATERNYMVSASSNHTGGVNTALADGSVHFVSDTINVGTVDAFLDGAGNPTIMATGPSPFGVWGAMGSRNGGESTSIL